MKTGALCLPKNEHWTDEWQNSLLTDKSTLTTRWDQTQHVWHSDNCGYSISFEFMPEFIRWVAASARSSVSVLGAITLAGREPYIYVRIENKFTDVMYCQVLDDVTLPYLLKEPFPDGNFNLQFDNFPIHKSTNVGELVKFRYIQVLEWRQKSLDLNIINVRHHEGVNDTPAALWTLGGHTVDCCRIRMRAALTVALAHPVQLSARQNEGCH
ncbi:hypothetical protein MRX96_006951 [Rhipicephalus microplus]